MNYVPNFNFFGVEAQQLPCTPCDEIPGSSTEGAVGCLRMHKSTGDIYKCVAASNGEYTWVKDGGGGSAEGAVLYTEQTLTPEQQAQARANIGAGEVLPTTSKSIELELSDGVYIGGRYYTSNGWKCSQKIPIFEGTEVYVKSNLTGSSAQIICFLDAAGVCINGYTRDDCVHIEGTNYVHEITVVAPPKSACAVISCYQPANFIPVCTVAESVLSQLSGQITKAEHDIAVLKNTSAPDSKVLVIGDSISTGTSSTTTGGGAGGASYGAYDKWVDVLIAGGFFKKENVKNNSFLGTGFVRRMQPSDVGGTTNINNFVDRIKAIENPSEYDLVVLFGGVNDFLGEDHETDTYYGGVPLDTFKAAVDEFFDYLFNNFTQARLAVILPLKCSRNTNGIGVNFTDYVDYIKTTAKVYSLPVLDLYNESGFVPTNTNFNAMWCHNSDKLHPNNAYQTKYLAPMIEKFLNGLV